MNVTSRIPDPVRLDDRSRHLRRLVVRALEGGGRGHVGSSLSLIEIIRVLYDDILRHRPHEPRWDGRDRFILSKGHGCLAHYAVLADLGYFPVGELANFCKRDSFLGGHPEHGKVPGVEASTGSLGHGLPIGLGMALAARIRKADTRVFVVLGDGEIDEGSVWEAAMCAGKHAVANLAAVVDYNKMQSYGPVSQVQPLEPLLDKWRAFGFDAVEVDGHDVADLRRAFTRRNEAKRPLAVICHTVKGRGLAFAENDPSWHHKNRIGPKQAAEMYAALERD
jgi:transketolase